MSENPDKTDFGFREVAPAEKTRLVREVFASVAPNYDVMNDLMSFGVHRLWKRWFVATSGVKRGDRCLDLAGGTGDIAALLAKAVGPEGEVVLTDINAAMLGVGRDRLVDRGIVGNVRTSLADASALPFASARFDLVTIAFGLRNVTDKLAALREMRRVLKAGGRALVLEFTPDVAAPLKPFYDAYSFHVLPRIGKLVADDEASYRYLAESIRKHPAPDELRAMMEAAGFARCAYTRMTGGLVAIHSGYAV